MTQKIIGMIGGTSWQSTISYYIYVNKFTNKALGGDSSAKVLISSVNYDELISLRNLDKWNELISKLAEEGKRIQNGGAAFVILCCNSLHKIADQVAEKIDIPFIHIASPVGKAIVEDKISKVGLLGTKSLMEDDFYQKYLKKHFEIECIVPSKEDQQIVDDIIHKELIHGQFHSNAKEKIEAIMAKLQHEGAQGMVLACTELGMIVKNPKLDTKIYDTVEFHAKECVNLSLGVSSPS